MYQYCSSTRSHTSQQSPADHTPSATRWVWSGTRPPWSPTRRPAAVASSTRGRTPTASATTSARCSWPPMHAVARPPSQRLDALDLGAAHDLDAEPLEPLAHQRPHRRVERRRHRLLAARHQQRLDASAGERLRRLDADEAAAHHDGAARWAAVASGQERAPGGAVVQRLDGVDAGHAPRPVGPHLGGPRGEQDVVEAEALGVAAVECAHGHLPAVEVELGHLAAQPKVDAVGPVLVGGAGDERTLGLDVPRDPVRHPALAVRRVLATLEGDHLETLAPGGGHPQGLARRAHAGGVRADHHQPSPAAAARRPSHGRDASARAATMAP